MYRKFIFILFVFLLTQFSCYTRDNNVENYDAAESEEKVEYSSSKILASASCLEEAQKIAREHGLKITTTFHAISSLRNRWYGVFEKTSSNRMSIKSTISEIKKQRRGLIAERDYQARSFAIPNDSKFSKLWGMHDSNDTDIDAVEAWNINTGSPQVIVGVVDSGINYNHPDLKANVWVNPREIPGNGIDDDNNGYIDDIHGINSITGSGDPADDHSHGTHISGTIGAAGNNGIGVAGVCWNVKIMGLKFLNKGATGDTSDAVKCIDYAIDQKLKGQNIVALNNSWGDLPFTQVFTDAVQACKDAGIIFVAAAGNGDSDRVGDNNDKRPVYPASFDFPHVVAVAATTDLDKLCKFSNYGPVSVDLGAPGIGIYSTKLKDTYGMKNGTSMAAPHVAGAIALLASQYPNETIEKRIKRIFDNVDRVPALAGKLATGGRLNVYKALTANGSGTVTIPPEADFTYETFPSDLSVALKDKSKSHSGNIVSWFWNFGDGNSSSFRNVTNRYTRPDTYKVTLTVKDNKNLTDSISRMITVKDSDVNYASLPYRTGFEFGAFDPYWTTETQNKYGRILITENNTPHSDNYHMTMDVTAKGKYSTNAALLHVDLSGESQVDLSFYWKAFDDESSSEDGVFFSDDGGRTFQKVYNLTEGPSTYRKVVIDVDQLASSMGLTLSSTFVIKFQQRDNYTISSDGFAFDDITVAEGKEILNQDPVANGNGPYTGTADNAVSFSSDGSIDPDGSIKRYLWDFGDGLTSSAANPVHTYVSEGTYRVALRVTDNEGAVDTYTTTARIVADEVEDENENDDNDDNNNNGCN